MEVSVEVSGMWHFRDFRAQRGFFPLSAFPPHAPQLAVPHEHPPLPQGFEELTDG